MNDVQDVIIFEDLDSAALSKDAAHIERVTLAGDLLILAVNYGGGCEPHTFRLYGWTGWNYSLPPQGRLYLSHDAHGDVCEAMVHEELRIDLSPLKAHWAANAGYEGPVWVHVYPPGGSSPVHTLTLHLP